VVRGLRPAHRHPGAGGPARAVRRGGGRRWGGPLHTPRTGAGACPTTGRKRRFVGKAQSSLAAPVRAPVPVPPQRPRAHQ
jgi:hypothetical protein